MSIWEIQLNFVLAEYKFGLWNYLLVSKQPMLFQVFLQFWTFMFDAIIEGLNYHCWYQTKGSQEVKIWSHDLLIKFEPLLYHFKIIVEQIFVEFTIFKPLVPATFMIIFGLLVVHFARDGELKPERGCECFMQT